MTAIISTGGKGPNFSLVKTLLNQRDFLIAADSGLERLVDWGFSPDMMVGDSDSLNTTYTPFLKNINVVPSIKDKDFTDTELAIQHCLERNATEIILLGGGGGRLDHLLGNVKLLDKYPQIKQWWTEIEKIQVWDEGGYISNHEVEATISIIPIGNNYGKIFTDGLQWELNNFSFSKGYSISNRCRKAQVSWQITEGRFMVIEPYE